MSYTEIKINLSNVQKKKIMDAAKNDEEIIVSIPYESLISGSDIIAVTTTQLGKINKSKQQMKGIKLKFSRTMLKHNIHNIEGGFLSALAAAAAPLLLPAAKAIGLGALSGTVGSLVEKLFGNGLYLKKGGRIFSLHSTQTGGVLFEPHMEGSGITPNKLETISDGIWG